jgi:hypothetical protein
VDLVVLFIWIVTAAAGLRLLAGKPAREDEPEPVVEAVPATAGVPAAASEALSSGGPVPRITDMRIATRPGQHPVLEFMHPALGILGLACWIAFIVTRDPGFAWVASGVAAVTICAGVSWFANGARVRRRAGTPDRRPPARLITVHGSGAGLTLVLAVLTAFIAYHA